MDQGPVQVTVTCSILPRKSSSDSTKTSLLVGVRPFQRPLTFSSKSTSTCWPKQFGIDLADDLCLQIFEQVEAAALFFVGDVIVHAALGNGISAGRVTGQMSDIQLEVR